MVNTEFFESCEFEGCGLESCEYRELRERVEFEC